MRELIDLHIHVGGAVAPHILWSIAHQQGFKLPVKNYHEFVKLITVNDNTSSLDEYLKIMHQWTEKIQSSPAAIERSIYEIIGKEYRSSNVTMMELRFNPMKRNKSDELDLDHIIHAALRGMDRAMLEYGVKAGLIFCMAREYDCSLNSVIVNKAIKYKNRGVIGIDLAGSETNPMELEPGKLREYAKLYRLAREAGLGTTIHTGETSHTGVHGPLICMNHLKPDRIGHGISIVDDVKAMKRIAASNIVLELCPTSNLQTCAIKNNMRLSLMLQTFAKYGVKYTINTDGPYLLNTNMVAELNLVANLVGTELSSATLDKALDTARKATFLR